VAARVKQSATGMVGGTIIGVDRVRGIRLSDRTTCIINTRVYDICVPRLRTVSTWRRYRISSCAQVCTTPFAVVYRYAAPGAASLWRWRRLRQRRRWRLAAKTRRCTAANAALLSRACRLLRETALRRAAVTGAARLLARCRRRRAHKAFSRGKRPLNGSIRHFAHSAATSIAAGASGETCRRLAQRRAAARSSS